jgi:hypothetical protein
MAACGGDLRATIRALILMNVFLEQELETKVLQGHLPGVKHGRFNTYSGLLRLACTGHFLKFGSAAK